MAVRGLYTVMLLQMFPKDPVMNCNRHIFRAHKASIFAKMGAITEVHVIFGVQLQTNQIAMGLQEHGLIMMEPGVVHPARRHAVMFEEFF